MDEAGIALGYIHSAAPHELMGLDHEEQLAADLPK